LHFGRNVVVPDLAGWRRERMPEIPRSHVFSVAPDWICEVVSPSTARFDRQRKMPIYAENVSYAWLLDPLEQYLEVRRLENGKWAMVGVYVDGEAIRIEPFEEIEINLRLIWGPPMS
jgi:Uma2 family endonuclease